VEGEVSACPMDEWEKGFFDRQRDVIDAYACGTITREQFLRDLQHLNFDYYEAIWQANQIRQEAAE
jgi:hypothetical protein